MVKLPSEMSVADAEALSKKQQDKIKSSLPAEGSYFVYNNTLHQRRGDEFVGLNWNSPVSPTSLAAAKQDPAKIAQFNRIRNISGAPRNEKGNKQIWDEVLWAGKTVKSWQNESISQAMSKLGLSESDVMRRKTSGVDMPGTLMEEAVKGSGLKMTSSDLEQFLSGSKTYQPKQPEQSSLETQIDPNSDDRPDLTSLVDIWNSRSDLKKAFPQGTIAGTPDNQALNDWWNQHGKTDYPATTLVAPGDPRIRPPRTAETVQAEQQGGKGAGTIPGGAGGTPGGAGAGVGGVGGGVGTGGEGGTPQNYQELILKALNDYLAVTSGQKSLADIRAEESEKLGIAGQQDIVGGFQRQMLDVEELLDDLESGLGERISGRLITEAQRQRILASERRPLSEELTDLSRAETRARTGLTTSRSQLADIMATEEAGRAEAKEKQFGMLPFYKEALEYQTPEEKSKSDLANLIAKERAKAEVKAEAEPETIQKRYVKEKGKDEVYDTQEGMKHITAEEFAKRGNPWGDVQEVKDISRAEVGKREKVSGKTTTPTGDPLFTTDTGETIDITTVNGIKRTIEIGNEKGQPVSRADLKAYLDENTKLTIGSIDSLLDEAFGIEVEKVKSPSKKVFESLKKLKELGISRDEARQQVLTANKLTETTQMIEDLLDNVYGKEKVSKFKKFLGRGT